MLGGSNCFTLMGDYVELMGEWLNEKIIKIPHYNWLYQIICFLMFRGRRKLSYKDLFLLIYGTNRTKMMDKEAKEYALYKIVEMYKKLNNKLPNGIVI